MHYVYVLKTDNKRNWYIGYTNNLIRRIGEHKKEFHFRLFYYEAFVSEKQARERERKLKFYGSAWRGLLKRIGA